MSIGFVPAIRFCIQLPCWVRQAGRAGVHGAPCIWSVRTCALTACTSPATPTSGPGSQSGASKTQCILCATTGTSGDACLLTMQAWNGDSPVELIQQLQSSPKCCRRVILCIMQQSTRETLRSHTDFVSLLGADSCLMAHSCTGHRQKYLSRLSGP